MISCLQKTQLKGLFFIALFFLLIPHATYSQDEVNSFVFEDIERTYEVYLPENFHPGMPLVLSLHGFSEDFEWYRDYTELHKSADTAGFVLVCPQAIVLTWNIGILVDPVTIRTLNFQIVKNVDDVGFISALIDTIYNQYKVNLDSVFACGFSTGGEMSMVLAGHLGHRFAAIASVAGPLYDPALEWKPVIPIPVLEIHGTAEEKFAPYNGRKSMWSVEKTINYWVEKNQCSLPADTIDLPDIVPEDNCTIQKITFSGGKENSEVVHYKVLNGGHSWPGSKTTFSAEGNKNMDIDANTEILQFFKRFENPYADIAFGKSLHVDQNFLNPKGGSLSVNATVVNPQNHALRVHALVEGVQFARKDSIELFDDGMHDDKEARDNVYGNEGLLSLGEDKFSVTLRTADLDAETEQFYHRKGRFITYGPVYANKPIATIDQQYISRPRIQTCNLLLANNSDSATVYNIKAKIKSDDFRVAQMQIDSVTFDQIKAGKIDTSISVFSFNYAESYNPDSVSSENPIRFNIDIYCDNVLYWSDSINYKVTALEEMEHLTIPGKIQLSQNYPNPFNPTTTIEFTLPKTEFVTLKIYNLLGQELVTLVSEKLNAGKYQFTWDASGFSSGVYYYRLQVSSTMGQTGDDFVQIRKLVVLK